MVYIILQLVAEVDSDVVKQSVPAAMREPGECFQCGISIIIIIIIIYLYTSEEFS